MNMTVWRWVGVCGGGDGGGDSDEGGGGGENGRVEGMGKEGWMKCEDKNKL